MTSKPARPRISHCTLHTKLRNVAHRPLHTKYNTASRNTRTRNLIYDLKKSASCNTAGQSSTAARAYLYTELHQNRSRNTDRTGRNSESTFTKLTTDQCFVGDTTSQTHGETHTASAQCKVKQGNAVPDRPGQALRAPGGSDSQFS
jgi:hypothetical protein